MPRNVDTVTPYLADLRNRIQEKNKRLNTEIEELNEKLQIIDECIKLQKRVEKLEQALLNLRSFASHSPEIQQIIDEALSG